MQLGSEAWTIHRNYLGEKLELCGSAQTPVGLYLLGDAEAEQAANALMGARSYAASNAHAQATAGRNPSDWLNLGSLFKPCSSRKEHTVSREPVADDLRGAETRTASVRANVPAALDAMRVVGPIAGRRRCGHLPHRL